MKKVYKYIKKNCNLPIARLQYTYKNNKGVIIIFGGDICVDFKEDVKNIKKMVEISLKPGFMFFNNSREGIDFFSNQVFKFTCDK